MKEAFRRLKEESPCLKETIGKPKERSFSKKETGGSVKERVLWPRESIQTVLERVLFEPDAALGVKAMVHGVKEAFCNERKSSFKEKEAIHSVKEHLFAPRPRRRRVRTLWLA